MTGVIFIMSDSLRADHLDCYAANHIHTPHLDKFAKEAAVFDRAYIASYPTVPNRLDLWTGRYNFPFRGWVPLAADDIILPEVLGQHDVTSQLVFDTPPLLWGGFYRGFSGWWLIRGHHVDKLITDPTIPTPLPAAPHKLSKGVDRTRQYLRNRASWQYEKDYIAPRTFTQATEWLEKNYTLPNFLLVVDTWDPHEPFDPPLHYLRRYTDLAEEVENIIYPAYGHCDYMTDAELQRVRALYAGEVSMVDTGVGQLLDAVDRLGLTESTLIIFTTDHGHLFGEHGLEGKPGGILGRLYEVTTRIPLLIRHPDGYAAGTHISGITQPPDIMPTILDFLKIPVPKTVHGRSVLPLMTEDVTDIHEYAFSARFPEGVKGLLQADKRFAALMSPGREDIKARTFDGWAGPGQVIAPITITNKRWALICNTDPALSELYDLDADPHQEQNVITVEPATAKEMRVALIGFLKHVEAKQEILAPFASQARLKETLSPDMQLYTMRDKHGNLFAYLSKGIAQERFSPHMKSKSIKPMSFQSILDQAPKAMIYLGDQYYWAEELA